MNTLAPTLDTTPGHTLTTRRSRPSLPYQVYCEILKTIRVPIFAISTFILPALLFSLFVLPYIDDINDGITAGQYTMPSFSVYVVMTTGFFSTAMGIASERSMKWNLLLRATPMKLRDYFLSKFIMAYIVGGGAVAFLFAFARIVGGVDLSIGTWLALYGTALAAMTPFIALGLLIGYSVGPQAAAGLGNLIILPLSFMSGLFSPIDNLPTLIRDYVAPAMPSYHAGELGWHLIDAGDSTSALVHILWLTGYTALFFSLAVVMYRRDEGKTYG